MLMRAIWTVLFMLAVTYPAGSQQLQPERDQRGTEEIPLIVKVLPAEQTEADRARDAEERERKAREAELVLFTGQLADYTHSLYVTTAALAFGTGVLILVGIGTAFWDHHSQKRRERTYVSGGGQVARGNRFEIHINNHGRTEARLKWIWFGFCDAAKIPPVPEYSTPISWRDAVAPGAHSHRVATVPIQLAPTEQAIFVRFVYDDIYFGECTAGFIVRIIPGEKYPEPIRADDAYISRTQRERWKPPFQP